MEAVQLNTALELFAVSISAIGSAIGAYIVIRSDLRILMAEHAGIRDRVEKVESKLERHIEGPLHGSGHPV